jgi:hypothetical protein
MKTFYVITACLTLAFTARAAQNKPDDNGPPPKKGAAKSEQVSQRGGVPAGRGAGAGGEHYQQGRTFTPQGHAYGAGGRFQQTNPKTSTAPFRGGSTSDTTIARRNATTTTGTYRARRFDLQTQTKSTTVPTVTYRSGSRIEGSRNWQGSSYTAFRDYSSQWHDRYWWRRHHDRIVFVFGSPYYWNSGYWYPAWGYDPYASYYYDGPIYAYNDLPPDQVIANVQAALQDQGYYVGEVDGILGPLTRAAIARYQQDHGLYVTSAIDEPTLESLGMV